MVWHLLPTISAPMSFQMALDEQLFQKSKNDPAMPPVLRFYYSSEPWITAGCSFRNADDRSRSELIKTNPEVPIAKRLTGGGCVLHGKDLIFSLITPYPPLQVRDLEYSKSRTWRGDSVAGFGSVRESYKKIHACVAAAFQKLGFDPRFYKETEELPKGDDCFSFPVAGDLSWKERKLAGGAQKRSGGVLLHHESIQIPDGMDPGSLIKAIRIIFAEAFGGEIQESDLDLNMLLEITDGLKTDDRRL